MNDESRLEDGRADDPKVSVRGEAQLEVEAELARLVLTVGARDRDRVAATERLATRSADVLAAVSARGEAVEAVETTGVRIYPSYRDQARREKIEGYVAQLTHTVTVVDFTVLGDLVAAVGDAETTDVSGPWWMLRSDSPHHREARTAAVHDALARAEQYAAALGSRVTGLVHLADVGLLGEGPSPPVLQAQFATARRSGGAEEPALSLEPQRQVVVAHIEARFTISPPSFGGPVT